MQVVRCVVGYPIAQHSMALNLPVMNVFLLFEVQVFPTVSFLRSFTSEGC